MVEYARKAYILAMLHSKDEDYIERKRLALAAALRLEE